MSLQYSQYIQTHTPDGKVYLIPEEERLSLSSKELCHEKSNDECREDCAKFSYDFAIKLTDFIYSILQAGHDFVATILNGHVNIYDFMNMNPMCKCTLSTYVHRLYRKTFSNNFLKNDEDLPQEFMESLLDACLIKSFGMFFNVPAEGMCWMSAIDGIPLPKHLNTPGGNGMNIRTLAYTLKCDLELFRVDRSLTKFLRFDQNEKPEVVSNLTTILESHEENLPVYLISES